MPGQRLSICVRSVSFPAIETGRHIHVNGITVNKTTQTVESAATGGAFHIEDVYPLIDGGRFPVKRVVGDTVIVGADVFAEGHDRLAAVLRFRRAGEYEFAVGDDADACAFEALLDGTAMRTLRNADFNTLAWRKLLINAVANPITALTLQRQAVFRRDDVKALCLAVLDEAAAVGRADGARLAADEPALVVDVEGYEGPLDLLLALARQQKVDLAKISILALADQYLVFIEEARKIRLELAADYLVMAAWLAYLKSRLLLPEPPTAEGPSAEEVAQARKIIAAFDLPENEDKGVIALDGRMVERLHAEMARRTLAIAEAIEAAGQ